ncbi:hypothetical protein [Salegentibacter sediminis]|uniref:hypothetical protein n=1 Tax=Salegentibacter sediminis TaxID=1930251 RepID=UPI0009BDB4A4|nr:hypothetical protein [Salegentibacter sediminis]
MNKTIFGILSLSLLSLQSYAQDSLSTNPVQDEFNELIESSNNYQGYKVVDYDALIRLKNNTNRHFDELRAEIETQKNTAKEQVAEIETLKEKLQATQQDLEKVNAEKDAIKFLGMPMSKGSYMGMMWGIVGILLIALLFFIYRYKNSHATTREARKRLAETEKEFDLYRTKALEKEQRLGRMLQDERNKTSNG